MHWKQKNAESKPVRTHKDEQLKYAQHVDPRKKSTEKTETVKVTTAKGTEQTREQRKAGTQPTESRSAGANRPVPTRSQHKTSHNDNPSLALLFLHSFACRVKPDLHGNDTSQCAHSVLPCAHLLEKLWKRLFLRSAVHQEQLSSGPLRHMCRFCTSCLHFSVFCFEALATTYWHRPVGHRQRAQGPSFR